MSPDSARYWMTLSQFNATSGFASTTFSSGGQAASALDAAERSGDRLQLARAADAAGLAAWRRYEPISKRALASDGRQVDLSMVSGIRRDRAVDYLNSFVRRIEPPTGDGDYKTAMEYFRRALEADPTNLRTARHYYMVLGEREQWEEMRAVARRRLSIYPLDWQSQLARGLAAHRLGDGKEAQAAFDSALINMDDSTRDRMTSLSRILRPTMRAGDAKKRKDGVGDAVAFNRLPDDQRNAVTSLYWLMADPLSITQENEHRNEFMARVTWADFRWSSEDHGLLGADTDRGDVYIRYGPPKLDMVIAGNSSNTQGAGNTLAWIYDGQQAFFFDMMPGFLSARTAFFDKDYVDQVKDAVPVSWANVPTTRTLDTIPIMTSRFRARGDSVDVVVAASIPIDSMVRGLDMDRAPVDIDIRVFDRFVAVRGVESVQSTFAPDSVRSPAPRSWIRRIGPGLNLLRVEALQADSRRAARAMSRIESDLGSGFGLSDILLGSAPAPRGGNAPRSWRDIETTPSSGTFSDAKIGLTWEIYELTNRNGQSKYRIEVAVERVTKGLGGFTARIVDNLGRTLGREQRGMNRLAFAFDRTAPAANTLVEYLTVNLADATAGEYRLRVSVVDQETRQRRERTSTFHIK
jgi:GWxTD domain-containing protein